MKQIVICILIVLWPVAGEAQNTINYFLEGNLHYVSIAGTAQYTDDDFLESDIDLESTFDFDRTLMFSAKGGVLLYQRHELLCDYRYSRFSNDVRLSSDIHFGDIDLLANFSASPEIRYQTVGVLYGYRVMNNALYMVAVRAGLEVVDYSVEISQYLFGIQLLSERYSATRVLPIALLAAEVNLYPRLSVAVEFSGGSIGEQSGYFIQPMLKFKVYSNAAIALGYSHTGFQDEADDNMFDVRLSGPFAGIHVTF